MKFLLLSFIVFDHAIGNVFSKIWRSSGNASGSTATKADIDTVDDWNVVGISRFQTILQNAFGFESPPFVPTQAKDIHFLLLPKFNSLLNGLEALENKYKKVDPAFALEALAIYELAVNQLEPSDKGRVRTSKLTTCEARLINVIRDGGNYQENGFPGMMRNVIFGKLPLRRVMLEFVSDINSVYKRSDFAMEEFATLLKGHLQLIFVTFSGDQIAKVADQDERIAPLVVMRKNMVVLTKAQVRWEHVTEFGELVKFFNTNIREYLDDLKFTREESENFELCLNENFAKFIAKNADKKQVEHVGKPTFECKIDGSSSAIARVKVLAGSGHTVPAIVAHGGNPPTGALEAEAPGSSDDNELSDNEGGAADDREEGPAAEVTGDDDDDEAVALVDPPGTNDGQGRKRQGKADPKLVLPAADDLEIGRYPGRQKTGANNMVVNEGSGASNLPTVTRRHSYGSTPFAISDASNGAVYIKPYFAQPSKAAAASDGSNMKIPGADPISNSVGRGVSEHGADDIDGLGSHEEVVTSIANGASHAKEEKNVSGAQEEQTSQNSGGSSHPVHDVANPDRVVEVNIHSEDRDALQQVHHTANANSDRRNPTDISSEDQVVSPDPLQNYPGLPGHPVAKAAMQVGGAAVELGQNVFTRLFGQ